MGIWQDNLRDGIVHLEPFRYPGPLGVFASQRTGEASRHQSDLRFRVSLIIDAGPPQLGPVHDQRRPLRAVQKDSDALLRSEKSLGKRLNSLSLCCVISWEGGGGFI